MSGLQFRIDPDAYLDDATINSGLGISYSALEQARRDGSLRFVRKGGRVLYLGAWIHEWLSAPKPTATKTRDRVGVAS
jgi:hypothetical protein